MEKIIHYNFLGTVAKYAEKPDVFTKYAEGNCAYSVCMRTES
jgi:hypothetical protein